MNPRAGPECKNFAMVLTAHKLQILFVERATILQPPGDKEYPYLVNGKYHSEVFTLWPCPWVHTNGASSIYGKNVKAVRKI